MNWSKLNCSSDSSSLWSHGLSSSSRSWISSSACFLRRRLDLVLELAVVWPLVLLAVSDELFLTVAVEDSSGLGLGVGCASDAGLEVELFLLVTVLPSILLLLRGFEPVCPNREISSLICRAVASFTCSKLGPILYSTRLDTQMMNYTVSYRYFPWSTELIWPEHSLPLLIAFEAR